MKPFIKVSSNLINTEHIVSIERYWNTKSVYPNYRVHLSNGHKLEVWDADEKEQFKKLFEEASK